MNSSSHSPGAALITGASSGIGKACALEISKKHPLVITARRENELRVLKNIIEKDGPYQCHVVAGDITENSTIERLKEQISSVSQAGLQVLINNSGGAEKHAVIDQLTEEDWDQAFELNLFSIVRLTNTLIPLFTTERFGRIINISSINALCPGYFSPHYAAAKSALNSYTKYLSNYLSKRNITVNTVSPGIISTNSRETHLAQQAIKQNVNLSEVLRKDNLHIKSRIPLGRMGECREVAKLVAFLASSDSGYITGSNYIIDGGKRNEL